MEDGPRVRQAPGHSRYRNATVRRRRPLARTAACSPGGPPQRLPPQGPPPASARSPRGSPSAGQDCRLLAGRVTRGMAGRSSRRASGPWQMGWVRCHGWLAPRFVAPPMPPVSRWASATEDAEARRRRATKDADGPSAVGNQRTACRRDDVPAARRRCRRAADDPSVERPMTSDGPPAGPAGRRGNERWGGDQPPISRWWRGWATGWATRSVPRTSRHRTARRRTSAERSHGRRRRPDP
jgi:hypothetical protein